MQTETHASEPREVAKDLATRLATARSWARSRQHVVVPGSAVGAASTHVAFTAFCDDPACKAERYGVAFGVTFVQDARVRHIEVRVRVKTQIGAGSPPYVATYVVRREPQAEVLVNFCAFKSPADYARFRALETVAWFGHWLDVTLAASKTQKLLTEKGVALAELNELTLEQACVAFTNVVQDSAAFADDEYVERERAPKEAASARFCEVQLPALRAALRADAPRDPAANESLAALGRSLLAGIDAPASVSPWLQPRDHPFTLRFEDAQWVELATAVGALLDESAALDERLQEFNRRVTECGTRPEQKSSAVQRRSLATYFLSLSDPAGHFHVDATLLNRLLVRLDAPRIAPEDLTADGYRAILDLARTIEAFLRLRGFAPRDLLDVHGFIRVVTGHVLASDEAETPVTAPQSPATARAAAPAQLTWQNLLLEGVPGVGKLRRAMALAVEICDGISADDPALARHRFEALVRENRICLVAPHPAFTYADFVEGVRPETPDDSHTPAPSVDAPGPSSPLRDGVLKRLARRALGTLRDGADAEAPHQLRDRQIFKLSLGTAIDREVEDYCMEHGVVAMAGAEGVDLGKVPRETNWEAGRQRIVTALSQEHPEQQFRPGVVFALWTFKDKLDVGDIVIVPRGARRISAIGVVEGDYRHATDAPVAAQHFRSARWLAKDLDVAAEEIFTKPFDQQVIYEIDAANVDFAALESLLEPAHASARPNYVLIVDGIERADAAALFGEAALLMAPAHRLGGEAPVEVTLPASGERFGLPDNLYVIATRNVRGPPLAETLRQRFVCETVLPDAGAIEGAGNGGIREGTLDLRHWLETLNARLTWLVGHHSVLGQGVLAHVASLDAFRAAYSSHILPHVSEVLENDPARMLAALGPRLARVDAPGESAPLHPAARLVAAAPRWRANEAPTLADFVSLYQD